MKDSVSAMLSHHHDIFSRAVPTVSFYPFYPGPSFFEPDLSGRIHFEFTPDSLVEEHHNTMPPIPVPSWSDKIPVPEWSTI